MSEPPRRRTGRIELVTGALFVVLMALVATTYPPFRDALDTARTTIGSLMPSPSWTGYYLEIEEADGSAPSAQLIFTSGSFPGRAARVIDPPFFPGRWSPSGEQFAFTSRSRLLIGDRGGGVRLVGELLDLVPAGPPIWAHEHELVLTMTRERAPGWWSIWVDARTGLLLDQRALAPYLRLESMSVDGRWALAWDERRAPDPQRSALVLYEPATARELPPRDGESFAGWAPDGRVLVRAARGAAWRLEARDAEASEGEVLADLSSRLGPPAIVHGPFIGLVEYSGTGAEASGSIWLIRPGDPALRVAEGLGSVSYASPSRDGRYVGFTTEVVLPGGPAKPRTGLIEVATGRVTYACDAGCAALDLR